MGPVALIGLITAVLKLVMVVTDYLRAHPELTADLSTLTHRLTVAVDTAEALDREIRGVPEAP